MRIATLLIGTLVGIVGAMLGSAEPAPAAAADWHATVRDLAAKHFKNPANLQLEPITRLILLEAAALRARYRLRTPDAIQLATGLQAGATLAVTNDDAWRNVSVIETIILTDLVK
jgi:predicted nucleic acid-binding protein